MVRPLALACSLGLVASIGACSAADPSAPGGSEQSSVVAASPETAFESTYPSMFLRGTMNGWGATAMHLVADNDWAVDLESGTGPSERVKFDVYGEWRLNFGDNDGDQNAEPNGQDIPVPVGRPLVVHFNDGLASYWIEEKTWAAEVALQLPEGVDRWALDRQRTWLSVDGEERGWSFVYVDDEHAAPYVPIGGLSRGAAATLAFDGVVAGKRLVGGASWHVDGTQDVIPIQMVLQEASLQDHGAVELTVLSDRWENGAMVSGPFAGVGVFLGDWHAGNTLGYTGDDGRASFMLPAGAQKLSTMVMTSSHSMASGALDLTVTAGKQQAAELHMAPTSVSIHAYYEAGWGKALYLTGASDYLGNWERARRMDFDAARNAWSYVGNLPLGLPFKVVLATWSDDPVISTQGVTWEQGPNRTVTPPQGYLSSEIDAYPSF